MTTENSPSPASVIDGTWQMVLATPIGPQEMTGHFKADGDVLTGEVANQDGAHPVTGTVDGNRLAFELPVEKPMKLTLKYDLEVTGDTIEGKVKLGMFGSAKLTGQRI